MRVLMIQAPSVEGASEEKVYPIGIVSLAGHLQKSGHQVELLDMNLEADQFGPLQEKLTAFRPEAVGLSLRNIDPLGNKTSSLIPPFVVTARLVRAMLPQALLIVGGTGFSLFPERIMCEVPQLDYGIAGEGERSFPALLADLSYPQTVPGLCWRQGEQICLNPPDQGVDMAAYLPPDRSLWNPAPYRGLNNYVPVVGIETKRGCPLTCAYCVYPRLQGRCLRCRTAGGVVDEIESLGRDFGITNFHFNDSVLNIPDRHLESICEEILRRGLRVRWDGFFREDRLNRENIALFERAGCECFSFSPDGLCQQHLQTLGKLIHAAELAAGLDTICVYHFMVNVPGESEQTRRQGKEMLGRIYDLHSRKQNLGTVVLNNIRILPGTRMEGLARAEGAIALDADLLYPVYYNPRPYNNLRYELETYHLCRNVFMWKGVEV
jgi:anaerobic magnesium-protoporphyrin IX monomethyl ester cyclase